MGLLVLEAGLKTFADLRLPSTVEWPRGELPQTIEGCPANKVSWSTVGEALGVTGPQSSPKRDSNISSAKTVYGLPFILPEKSAVFQRSQHRR